MAFQTKARYAFKTGASLLFLLLLTLPGLKAAGLPTIIAVCDSLPPAVPGMVQLFPEPLPGMPARSSTLYTEVENPLTLVLPDGISAKNIVLRLNGKGTLHQKDDNHYTVSLNETGSVGIAIFEKKADKEVYLDGKVFKVLAKPAAPLIENTPGKPNSAAATLQDVELKGGDKVSVETGRLNTLYTGVENKITLYVHGYDSTKCTTRLIGEGTLSGTDGKHFTVTIPGNKAVDIEIAYNDNGTEKILTRQHFRVERLPDPVLYFSNRKSGNITREQLLAGTALQPLWTNLDFQPPTEVISYTLILVAKDGSTRYFNLRGAELPADALRAMKDLTDDATVFFDDVKVKCQGDSKPRELHSLLLTVKG